MKIDKRKLEHIKICVEKEVESGATGFDSLRLEHRACPEIDFDKINLGIKFLGKSLSAPLIIDAITGGASSTEKINKDLAKSAQKFNLGFSVGSQRMAIDDPGLEGTYKVRDVAPDILIIANLGAVQLNYGYGLRECKKAIEMIDADALALHLNPLQEAIQSEGNRNFSGLIKKINGIARKLKKPVIVKEVGSGLSYKIAKQLKVDAFNTGGVGGTSWGLIEGYRGGGKTRQVGETFSDWGIPTAESIRELSRLKKPLIASGGVRSGLDAAKALASGTDCVAIALPLLRAWSSKGREGVEEFIQRFLLELRIAMFLTGSLTPGKLRGKIR